MIFRSNIVNLIKLNPKLMPDFRHKCLSQIESQHSIRLLTTGTEQRWSSEETPKSEDRSIYSAAKYTESDAHRKHRSYQNYRWSDEEVQDIPWYQRPILMTSAAIFFIYFGYLREPNDLDKKLDSDLFELVPHLEVPLIESAIQESERFGNDTRVLKERLAELKALKEEVAKQEALTAGSKKS